MFQFKKLFSFMIPGLLLVPSMQGRITDSDRYVLTIKATDKFERSLIANEGIAIEQVGDGYVTGFGNAEEKAAIEKLGLLIQSAKVSELLSVRDFPTEDADFHNYTELKAELDRLQAAHPTIMSQTAIGKTVEGREIWAVRISGDLATADAKPGIIYMGGHHAREHLSVEMPLRWARYLLEQYAAGNVRVKTLVDSRDIHIVPAVNPDGLEYDIANGKYQFWRKNRRLNSNNNYGVDLNRNYGFLWGTGGSSANASSDTYKGPSAFSEPETQAIKNHVEAHKNITTLLTFHTFSKLILYPWGHTDDSVPNGTDLAVFEKMAKKMAEWNGYKPQQSSDLYITSGDTTDWAYGEHKIIAFTFELDPAGGLFSAGGFYPGAKIIKEVVDKNIEPCLYLLEYADNPRRVLNN
ncbi:MAG: M14 family metallopeptidase [Bdellovibrionota bacterium]